MVNNIRSGVIVKLFKLFQSLINLKFCSLKDQFFSFILFLNGLNILLSFFYLQHLDVRVGLLKSNNLTRYSFSRNPCRRPTSLIIYTVHILTFDQTELANAFVPNHLFLFMVQVLDSTSLVEGFDCCILLFVVKVVIQCFDLLLKIVLIIR